MRRSIAARQASTTSTSPPSQARATPATERHRNMRRTAMMSPTPSRPSFDRFAGACRAAVSALGLTPGAQGFSNQIGWAIGFLAACSVLIVLALFILWALAGFRYLGVSGHGLVALIPGILFTNDPRTGAMALSFYGDHGESDD